MAVTQLLSTKSKAGEQAQRPFQERAGLNVCDICDLALEADHRIANHLAMLSAYVRLRATDLFRQPAAPTNLSIQLAFEGVSSQIEALSLLHRSLATRKGDATVDLAEYLHQVCAPFMSGLSGAIALSEDLRVACYVRNEQILPLTQIVSEVITNAIKYSHASGETGKVHVGCRAVTDRRLEIEVVDDGTGLPELLDPATSHGLGFRLIHALAAQIGAQFGFESSAMGTRFWLTLASAPE